MLIPSVMDAQMTHQSIKPQEASLSKKAITINNDEAVEYTIRYISGLRTLTIIFEKAFPHRILKWKETDPNGRHTVALLKQTHQLDYWNKNRNKNQELRSILGTDPSNY